MSISDIVEQTGLISYLDISVILVLLALGFLCKHATDKIKNDQIPDIILIASFIIEILKAESYNMTGIVNIVINAIISSAIAIGLHSNGKRIFKNMIQGSISSLNTISSDDIEEDSDTDEEEDNEDI